VRPGRRAKHRETCRYVLDDDRSKANRYVISDINAIPNGSRGRYPTAFADRNAAANYRSSHDHRIRAHDNVVSDVRQIIDLRAATDKRITECSAIDGRIRADLNIIVNFNAAQMRETLQRAALRTLIAESFTADHGTRIDYHASTYANAIVQDRTAMDDGVGAYGALSDVREWTYSGACIYPSLGIYICTRVHPMRNRRNVSSKELANDANHG
jgi:hypothetical protein